MARVVLIIGVLLGLAAIGSAPGQAQESTPIPVVVTVVVVFPTHTPTPTETPTPEPTPGPSETPTPTLTPTADTLVKSTVEVNGVSQDIGIRYEVTGGEIVISLMLFIIAGLLLLDVLVRLKKS